MRLTVCNQTNESIAQIEIDSTAPLVHLQAMIAVEFPSIPEERQVLMHDGKVLIGGDDEDDPEDDDDEYDDDENDDDDEDDDRDNDHDHNNHDDHNTAPMQRWEPWLRHGAWRHLC